MGHAPTPTGGVSQVAMLGDIAGKIFGFVGRAVTGIVGDTVYAAAKLWEDHYCAAQASIGVGRSPNSWLQCPFLCLRQIGKRCKATSRCSLFKEPSVRHSLGMRGSRTFRRMRLPCTRSTEAG